MGIHRREFMCGLAATAAAWPIAVRPSQEPVGVGDSGVNGCLRPHPHNPRYFTDNTGKPIYLTGSHTWANFQDVGRIDPPVPTDYDAYLSFVKEHNGNFFRLWTWEQSKWIPRTTADIFFDPPWAYTRSGPGLALDGKPKFNLDHFNQAYFDRMRDRVKKAYARGIYTSIMLFQGFSGIKRKLGTYSSHQPNDPWPGHPYNVHNNIQQFNGDKDGDSITDFGDPGVRERHALYIRKVIDTVNGLDNVMYEVINEGGEKDWDWWVVRTVHDYEKGKPTQHPVGITGAGAERLSSMLASPADWVSPGGGDDPAYREDPPSWAGEKVSILDTDHVFGHGINYEWVWKGFVRGHNLVFMDPWMPHAPWPPDAIINTPDYPDYEPARKAMGHTRAFANRIDLAHMVPRGDLASNGFCLAFPGEEYLVFQQIDRGNFTVDLTRASGPFSVEWFDVKAGRSIQGGQITGGSKKTFQIPFIYTKVNVRPRYQFKYAGAAVLYLKRTPGGKT
jgi:hypothetical protein